jgi:serine phosphatase RsbU (regulator of sigma subunit)
MDSQHVKILLVEDDPDDVWNIRTLLADRWDGPYELVHFGELGAALEIVREGQTDVVLLDLSLPDSHGLETFLVMYAQAGDVPIVVLTGLNDENTAVRAVQAGAQDYLVKGQVSDELLVRSIRYAIERSRRRHAEEALRATSEEFRAAQQIQKRLFPASPPELPGFDIGGAVYPARATAGDYFDYLPMRQGAIGLVIGDVSGHGMGPALVMAETRACLRTLAQTHDDVSEILTLANQILAADSEEFYFVTLALARLEPRRRLLSYAGAGQRGYLLDPSGRATMLDSTGPPLGVDRKLAMPPAPALELQPGQILAYFTDGAVEADSWDEGRFGAERVLAVIHAQRNKPAQAIVESLYEAVREFSSRQPQLDDITALIVKVLPRN